MTFATTSFCSSSAKRTFTTTTSQNVRGPATLPNSCCRFMVSRSPVFDIYDAFHLVANSDVTTTIPNTAAAATSFEPQLNVPAFGVFLLILIVFSFLQFRISRIGEAADRRTEALEELRIIKSKELSGQLTDSNAVDRALQAYKEAVEQVESLRTIVPGVRIAPPPASQSLTRQRMDENVAAAKQFLGVDLVDPSSSTDEGTRNESPAGLSPGLVALLALVVVMQIGLLGLLSVDPMSGMDFMDTIDTLSGLE